MHGGVLYIGQGCAGMSPLSHTPLSRRIYRKPYRYTTALPIYRGERWGRHVIEAGVGPCGYLVGFFWDKGDTGVTSHHAVCGVSRYHCQRTSTQQVPYRVLHHSKYRECARYGGPPHAHRHSHRRRAVLRAAWLVENMHAASDSEPYTKGVDCPPPYIHLVAEADARACTSGGSTHCVGALR